MNKKYLFLTMFYIFLIIFGFGCAERNEADSLKKIYKSVITYENHTDLDGIEKILDEHNIDYIIKDSSSAIEVLENEYYDSIYLLGKYGYTADIFKLDNTDVSLKGTEVERDKVYFEYITNNIKLVLDKSVSVQIDEIKIFNENELTITENNEPYIKVQLSLKVDSDYKDICKFVASAVGSESVEKVIITDKDNNLVYGDEDVYEYMKAAGY